MKPVNDEACARRQTVADVDYTLSEWSMKNEQCS